MKDFTVTIQDYADAVNVQNACNLAGVVKSFAAVMPKIVHECREAGTDAWNKHPIARLYAQQIIYLAGTDLAAYTDALAYCKKQAGIV